MVDEYDKMVERHEMRLSVPTGGSFRYTDFAGVFKSDFIQMLERLLSLCEQDGKTKEYHHVKEIQKELRSDE